MKSGMRLKVCFYLFMEFCFIGMYRYIVLLYRISLLHGGDLLWKPILHTSFFNESLLIKVIQPKKKTIVRIKLWSNHMIRVSSTTTIFILAFHNRPILICHFIQKSLESLFIKKKKALDLKGFLFYKKCLLRLCLIMKSPFYFFTHRPIWKKKPI